MARREDKEKAIRMRKKGMSYSQIREQLDVSKGTLSQWLRDFPLSDKRLRELRDKNPRRIEKYRATMKRKRDEVISTAYTLVSKDIGQLSERDMLIAGFFMYWGEGTKSLNASTSVSNTDPSVLLFFLEWLQLLGIPKEKVRVRLQLYSDMDVKKEELYWSENLSIPLGQFRKSYVKKSKFSDISYIKKHTHGTCDIIVNSRALNDYVLMGIKYLQGYFYDNRQR